jgi:RecT family
MNMTEPEIIEPNEDLGEPIAARPTKRELIEKGLEALDLDKIGTVPITAQAGGIDWRELKNVLDTAKLMATSGVMVPRYLRGNPGACLGITFKAIHWRMDPFEVAEKSYVVNDRVGFESQLIHAVIEARAPLQHRLDCQYEGEGGERVCIVRGMFVNGDVREYVSPMIKDIRTKNSPLWTADPDQQLFYFASRSWARKWCPDVLMGVYSREELKERSDFGREGDEASGLQARLAGSERSVAGYNGGHTARELATLNEAETPRSEPSEAVGASDSPTEGQTKPPKRKRASELPRASDDDPQPDTVDLPSTVAGYKKYANAWIKQAESLDEVRERWTAERKLRNEIGMTADDREPLEAAILKRRKEWESK